MVAPLRRWEIAIFRRGIAFWTGWRASLDEPHFEGKIAENRPIVLAGNLDPQPPGYYWKLKSR